jgi:hypothetical protein
VKLPFGKSVLRKAIERGLAQDTLKEELDGLGEVSLVTKRDAEDVLWGLRKFETAEGKGLAKRVEPLVRLCRKVGGQRAFLPLHEQGIPILLDLFDRMVAEEGDGAGDTPMLILKTAAMFLSLPGALKVVEEAQRPYRPGAFMWSPIFAAFDADHPHMDLVFRSFREKQPPDFAGISLLDAANGLLVEGGSIAHPFDSDSGVRRLREWLLSEVEDEESYARSATVALPFLTHAERNRLLDLAMEHRDAEVKTEAAWAAAKLGKESGFQRLVEFSTDLNLAKKAASYLNELQRGDLIPAEARDPDFRARADFSQWLAHPCELGKAPDKVEVMDHRVLAWPPECEAKPFWLLKYLLKDRTGLADDDVGCGLVGSVTFCLFSYELENRPPEDGYAIHCYWEMECAKLIDETPVEEDPEDYESLLEQWTGGPLEGAKLLRVVELDPKLRHPQQLVGVASARLEGAEGWVALDGERSQWYPKSSMPAGTTDREVLKIHVGRRLLGFETDVRRVVNEVAAPPKRPPTDIVAAFEKLLAEAAISKKSDPYDCFGPLYKHLDVYAGALVELGRGNQVGETVRLLAPHWDHHMGRCKLGALAFHSGCRDVAEGVFLKIREDVGNNGRFEEMEMLAEIWHGRGEEDNARALLLEGLRCVLKDSKTADGSPDYLEGRFQSQRQMFLKLFPEEGSSLVTVLGIPETTRGHVGG